MTEVGSRFNKQLIVQWFVHLLVIFVCFGKSAPAVNESHYLPKAKHHWDESFAPGDLFLSSHDSHLAATTLGGVLAKLMPLVAVAWVGRIVCWSLFAWAWIDVCRALRISKFLSPLTLAAWYFAMEYGHWAGEWAIGGFEAKAVAYPFVLKGVAACVENRWRSVWVWMGLAVAWHPVVGGWAGLSAGLIWIGACIRNSKHTSFTTQLVVQAPFLAAGALIGLVGVLPALTGIGGEDRAGKVVASQVQVYYRLAHHMSPRTFAPERHWAAVATLIAFAGAVAIWLIALRGKETSVSKREPPDEHLDSSDRVARLLQLAAVSVAFSMCGLLFDAFSAYQPNITSKLLRFYWFRWSDVAVPLAWTLTFWHFVSLGINQSSSNTAADSRMSNQKTPKRWAPILLTAGALLTGLCLAINLQNNWNNTLPPADALVVHSTGPNPVETEDRYVDFLAACEWIRTNTPSDSLWLTPKHQQTFKWHAHRAEVVCWKDVPQDNSAILEWYDRIQRCEPPRTPAGKLAGWSTEELRELHAQYKFGWVLVDRTIQVQPPMLEIAYPIEIPNRSFAVFRMPHN